MCGSPTVILNMGFAACSRLTLGGPVIFPSMGVAACTGGGARPLELPSLVSSTSSSMIW